MDWLDYPVRLFAWLDQQLASWASAEVRLIVWSAGAGVATMLLYALLSPQRRIARAKLELAAARARLDRFDGEFAEALPLMRRMIGVALAQLGLVLGPAVAALLPMALLAGWIAQTYGYDFPEQQQPVSIRTQPENLPAQWIPPEPAGRRPARVALLDWQGQLLGELEVSSPVPVIEKRTWQAALAGSPLGFLPDELPIERIELHLPHRQYLGWGPDWMRRWEFLFFGVLTLAAVAVKRTLRIQ